jgi:hypothetical protein
MLKYAPILLILLTANSFAQTPRIDSMVVIPYGQNQDSVLLDIHGSFGLARGSVTVDTMLKPIINWTDTVVEIFLIRADTLYGYCGLVQVDVNGKKSNSRILTYDYLMERFTYDHVHYFDYHEAWIYDFHSFFLNHKNNVKFTPTFRKIRIAGALDHPDSLSYDFYDLSAHVPYQSNVMTVSLDSNFIIKDTNDANYSFHYYLQESCTPPMTAKMIYRGVTLYKPVSNIENPDTSGILLEWVRSQYFDSYHLQVSTDSTFSTLFVDTNVTGFQFALPLLHKNVTYYWRVNGTNIEGISRWPDAWHFTTSVPSSVRKVFNNYIVLHCYPNPAGKELTISLPNENNSAWLILYDLQGRVLKKENSANCSEIKWDVSAIANGTYFLDYVGDRGSKVLNVSIAR